MTQLLSSYFLKKTSHLDEKEIASIIYHDIFDYPLNIKDLIRWRAGEKVKLDTGNVAVSESMGNYFLEGKAPHVYKKLMKQKISKKKMLIAKRAARILSFIPTIKMVGVTGALAMGNAGEDSDVDLMIITRRGTLWSTRLATLLLLKAMRVSVRRFSDRLQKDKLCLNLWLDELDLSWHRSDRNIFTAHELAQVIPLYNSTQTFEKLISANKWIKYFWPYAVVSHGVTSKRKGNLVNLSLIFLLNLLNKPLMRLQYWYMSDKITREVVSSTRAQFHPVDWGSVVLTRMHSYQDGIL